MDQYGPPQGHQQYAPPPYGQPPGNYGYTPPPKRGKGPLFWIMVIVLPFILLAGCIGAIAAVGGDTPKKDRSTTTASQSNEPAAKQPGIGDVVKDGKLAFKVTKVTTATRVGGEFLNKDAQGVFILVHITVKNIGDESQGFTGAAQKLFDAKGKEYSADSSAAIYLGNSKSLYEEINPGNSVKGIVLFDAPEGTKAASIELHDSVLSGGVKVDLK